MEEDLAGLVAAGPEVVAAEEAAVVPEVVVVDFVGSIRPNRMELCFIREETER